jgi:hypothetical protein
MVNYSEVYNEIHANLHEGDYWTAKLQFECGINENGSVVTSKLVDLVLLLQPNQILLVTDSVVMDYLLYAAHDVANTFTFNSFYLGGKNRIAKDVDLTALLRYHTPPCDRNHASCDARKEWT